MHAPTPGIDSAGSAGVPGADRRQLLQEAARLYALTERLERFVREQSERWERLLETVNSPTQVDAPCFASQVGTVLPPMPAGSALDEEELQADARLLREAWQQLEAERRQLLTERQAWPQTHAVPQPVRALAAPAPSESVRDAAALYRGSASVAHPAEPTSVSYERKMLEFQQLRRDMQRKSPPPRP